MSEEFQLTGGVSYSVRKKYKWLSEPGACKACKALHGELYDKGEVPKWLHPNCRCHVEEVSIIDETVGKMHGYQEELKILKTDVLKMAGDIKISKDVLYNKIANLQNKEIEREKEQLSKEAEYLENQINLLMDELNSLSKIYNFDYIKEKSKHINTLKQQVIMLNRKVDDLRVKNDKAWLDIIVEKSSWIGKDAAALWKLSSSKFKEGTDYKKKMDIWSAKFLI